MGGREGVRGGRECRRNRVRVGGREGVRGGRECRRNRVRGGREGE